MKKPLIGGSLLLPVTDSILSLSYYYRNPASSLVTKEDNEKCGTWKYNNQEPNCHEEWINLEELSQPKNDYILQLQHVILMVMINTHSQELLLLVLYNTLTGNVSLLLVMYKLWEFRKWTTGKGNDCSWLAMKKCPFMCNSQP